MSRDPRRAYRVVDAFEEELAAYTGAPFAVVVNSCTNALFLALVRERERHERVELPRKTYVGVLQAALNAGFAVDWWADGVEWIDWYALLPTRVRDNARAFRRDAYWPGSLTCLSFHAEKQLPLGRGGAILTDDEDDAEWLRAARMDGRPPGKPLESTVFPGWHMPLAPDVAARGLDILSRWTDHCYSPPPLPDETYGDLSSVYVSLSQSTEPEPSTVQSGSEDAR